MIIIYTTGITGLVWKMMVTMNMLNRSSGCDIWECEMMVVGHTGQVVATRMYMI